MAFIPSKSFTDRTGSPFVVRTADVDDAAPLLTYIRGVARETRFFVFEPDEFPVTVTEEEGWILEHRMHPGQIALLAEAEGKIIGSASFEAGSNRRTSHRGTLGIGVAQAWRERGVGTALLGSLIDWAADSPKIEKVCLEVFAANETAIQLYRKLGFLEEGRKPQDIKRGPDDYEDAVAMYRFVK